MLYKKEKAMKMKKTLQRLTMLLLVIAVNSCTSVRVASDYDKEANFESFKTFAFFKTGIDKAELNDLDKRRILRAIESEMVSKGFLKSSNPDLLVSIFTKSKERVNVYNNAWGFGGWGWGGLGGWGMGMNQQPAVSTSTEGVLYIDLIDAEKKELVWQGTGTGYLQTRGNVDKKEARIKEFVMKIMEKYPPGVTTK
jgi:hypothetical protein